MFCRVKYLELKKSSRGQEREIKYAGQLVKKRKMKSKSEKKKKKKKTQIRPSLESTNDATGNHSRINFMRKMDYS